MHKKTIEEKLKPCPLCHSDDLYVFQFYNGVICCNCGIRMVDDKWFEKWNRREWRFMTDRIVTCAVCSRPFCREHTRGSIIIEGRFLCPDCSVALTGMDTRGIIAIQGDPCRDCPASDGCRYKMRRYPWG